MIFLWVFQSKKCVSVVTCKVRRASCIKSHIKILSKIIIKMLMTLDSKNTFTESCSIDNIIHSDVKIIDFIDILVKSSFATPTPFVASPVLP